MRHIWLIDIVLIYRLVYNPRRHLMVSTQLDLHVSTGSSSETLHSCFAFHRSVLGTGWAIASFSIGLATQTQGVVPSIGWRWPWHLPSYWPFGWSSWSGNSPVPSSVWLVREALYNLDLSDLNFEMYTFPALSLWPGGLMCAVLLDRFWDLNWNIWLHVNPGSQY